MLIQNSSTRKYHTVIISRLEKLLIKKLGYYIGVVVNYYMAQQ